MNSRKTNQPLQVSAADLTSIDGIVDAIYETISFPPGGRPDWERDRTLFVSSAHLTPAKVETGSVLTPMSVEEFIVWADRYLEKDGFYSTGFHETDVCRVTESYGHIAHVFSTYESRFTADDPLPFKRGINSIQLIWDQGRWWATSIIWDMESESNPIPANYLETKKEEKA